MIWAPKPKFSRKLLCCLLKCKINSPSALQQHRNCLGKVNESRYCQQWWNVYRSLKVLITFYISSHLCWKPSSLIHLDATRHLFLFLLYFNTKQQQQKKCKPTTTAQITLPWIQNVRKFSVGLVITKWCKKASPFLEKLPKAIQSFLSWNTGRSTCISSWRVIGE